MTSNDANENAPLAGESAPTSESDGPDLAFETRSVA